VAGRIVHGQVSGGAHRRCDQVASGTSGGRPLARIGGLAKDEIAGEDGLR
jgi:hypothetical protein